MSKRLLAAAGLALFGFGACADSGTSVPPRTANPTPAQQTRDRLDAARGPAEAQGRALDRARNPERP
ncbi:MAG: hypothetical protein AVDCRST_MAG08-917 [uncultured Acetobacteraceae bacterium]|uniref:Uncharacterized protein n=1 Tax=uncultured Acetobacteraceae bacterium TaxID=169975 RepID=A0A6J4HLE3_9PROT|nr:MAG: hypothetical protein AVDCRST_MAG08-917 [uncultured Acetobacteraceae bacterium]